MSMLLAPWHERLRSRKGRHTADLLANGVVRVQGEREWQFEGTREEVCALAGALPGVADALSESLVLLSFGNSVGFFDVPDLGRIEVVSGKWDSDHFDLMLRELTDVATALPFSSGDVASLPYDRSVAVHEDLLYHAFVYLRHVLLGAAEREERLLPAVQLVLQDPHRHFARTEHVVPLDTARQVSGRGLLRMVAGGRMNRASGLAAERPLARALRGYLPETVEESIVRATVDTPENRFAKALLSLCSGTIDGMRRAVGAPRNAFQRRILGDCDRMAGLLRPVTQHALWLDVGTMVHFPAASTVLQRKRGYRELLRHWIRLRLATRLPLSADRVRDLLEVKDIAELYELWCYFVVVREIEALKGPAERAESMTRSSMQVAVPWDFQVRWADGTRAVYNARFSRSKLAGRRSYSVPLRPDIAVEIPTGLNAGLHLLDAKFKVEVSGQIFGTTTEDESEEQSAAERRGDFKRGDLYKMHTYRDAIDHARSVWILYPGTELSFFSAGEVPSGSVRALPSVLDGVGGIPLVPGGDGAGTLRAVLGHLLGGSAATSRP